MEETPFHAHIELLDSFLAHRDSIVEKIESLLNAQRKPAAYLQDSVLLSRHFEECFSRVPGVTHNPSSLRNQLQETHWSKGFKPRRSPGTYNDLVDAAEMMIRGFYLWQQTHWPGHSGRVRFAHTLFNLHVIRWLTLLGMRIWEGTTGKAGEQLSQIQGVLDRLWKTAPHDQPMFVRDARWLLPLAQSPTTDELHGYFEVAQQIAEGLPKKDRMEIHKAGIRMAGGHLRSQLHYLATKNGVPFDDHKLLLNTRTSNALDLAMLIQGLVPILDAYEQAIQQGNVETRRELASTICQGISPDPELFLNRLDLLGPYSMIEHLFITVRDEKAEYTPMGKRHLQLVQEYESRILRLSTPLYEDCRQFRPVGAYSPYGVLFGYSFNLIEHMALKSLRPDTEAGFSLEDVFDDGDAVKRAWVSGWRKLPHIKPEVAKLFEYPQSFAEEIFSRVEHELHRSVSDRETNAPVHVGKLHVVSDETSEIPDLPVEYIRSSDMKLVVAEKAHPDDETHLLHSRFEGEFLLSYKTSGGWNAILKDVLTDVLGAGQDVKIAGLPREAAGVLKLMAPDLVRLPELL